MSPPTMKEIRTRCAATRARGADTLGGHILDTENVQQIASRLVAGGRSWATALNMAEIAKAVAREVHTGEMQIPERGH